jgi:hypothetical protein
MESPDEHISDRVLQIIKGGIPWLTWTLLLIIGLFLGTEVIMHLWVDQPLNFYEPELAMDAYRLSEGLTIYPDFEQGPFGGLYAPLYQIVTSLFFVIGWQELATLRLISIGSIVVTAYFMVRSERFHNPPAVSGGFFLALLLLLIWHNDVVRFDMHGKPDAFAAMWLIVGIYFVRQAYHYHFSLRSISLAMAALTLAFATKQTMLFAIPPTLLIIWVYGNFTKAVTAGGLFTLFSLMLWPVLWLITGPNMWFYVFQQAGVFPYRWGNLFNNIYTLLSHPLILLTGALLLWELHQHKWKFAYSFLTVLLLFSIPAGVITAIKTGGMANAHLPTFWICSMIIFISLPRGKMISAITGIRLKSNQPFRYQLMALSFVVLLFLQLGIKPYAWLRSFDYRLSGHQAYNELADNLRDVKGQVYCPWDNYLTLKASKPLVWSIKWERETGLHGIQANRSYEKIALNSTAVVTVTTSDSRNSTLPTFLDQHDFTQQESFAIWQTLTYHLWVASPSE